MELLFLLYPLTAFIYLRVALACLTRWARAGHWIWLAAGCLAMAATIDSSLRLFEVAAIAPSWWITPLVGFALVYVFLKTARSKWRSLARCRPMTESWQNSSGEYQPVTCILPSPFAARCGLSEKGVSHGTGPDTHDRHH